MKNNRKTIERLSFLLAVIISLSSCSVFKSNPVPKYEIDLVCGMKIAKSEAYTYKYEGKKYFFDNYNCKQSFIMNPKKFLDTQCTDKEQ